MIYIYIYIYCFEAVDLVANVAVFKRRLDDNMVLLNGNMEYCEFNTKVQELLKFLENSNLDDEEIGSMYASLKESYHHINSPLFLHETKRRKSEGKSSVK